MARVGWSAALVAAAVVASTGDARADGPAPPRTGSPYELTWGLDVPLFGIGATTTALNLVDVPPAPCLPRCEPPAGMNAMDRTVLGKYSPSAHTVADVLVVGLIAVPQVANLIDSRGAGWLEDSAVAVEALLLAQGATQALKFAVRRGAPILYDERVPLEERQGRDASRSFPSGHASTAFAAATSYTVTYWLRHPDDPWRWVVLAGTHSLAMSASLLKIAAGYHYFTDIGAGALLGSSIGVLVPFLHRRF